MYILSRVQFFATLNPARFLCPWTSPGKNTGVGCRFLLQYILYIIYIYMYIVLHMYWYIHRIISRSAIVGLTCNTFVISIGFANFILMGFVLLYPITCVV